MAKTLLHQYWDIPEGTECHRKTYAATSIGGASGEHRPGPQGVGRREAVRSPRGLPEGVLEGLRTSRGGSSRRRGMWGGLGTPGALLLDRLCGVVGLTQRAQRDHRVREGPMRAGNLAEWVRGLRWSV